MGGGDKGDFHSYGSTNLEIRTTGGIFITWMV